MVYRIYLIISKTKSRNILYQICAMIVGVTAIMSWICIRGNTFSKEMTTKNDINIAYVESITLIQNAISQNERNEIIKSIDGGILGKDLTSKYFIRREKCIRFVMTLDTSFFVLNQDFFIQDSVYNEFSGGYKRYYELCPDSLLQNSLANIIKLFIKHNKLPEKSIVLIQLQSSYIKGNTTDEEDSQSSKDVTGQGVHTDGANNQAIICIERYNTQGAETQFYSDIDGSYPLTEPFILESGQGVFFRDNKLYHSVLNMTKILPKVGARRTVLLITDFAEMFLLGKENPNNTLRSLKSVIKLKNIN